MMETRLAALQVDVSKETGEVMLWIETACGLRPVMGWPDVSSLRDFAENLLGICSDIKRKGTPAASYPVDDSPDSFYSTN